MLTVVRSSAVLLTTSLVLSRCATFPTLEVCIIGDNGKMQCVDQRKPKGQQEYERYPDNDICTNADDYNSALNWVKRHDK